MHNHVEKDRQHHEAIAHEYDAVVVQPRVPGNDRLFSRFDPLVQPGRRMLDAACGTGHLTLRFGHRFDEVVAVDHSAAMLAQAQRKVQARQWRHVRFECRDVPEFVCGAPPASFQLVTCVGFLHHLLPTDVPALVAGLASLLVPGGLLLVSEPVRIAPGAVPPALENWNRRSIAARTGYSVTVEEPDEAPLEPEVILGSLAPAGLALALTWRSFEIFPHHEPPSLRDRWSIGWLDRRFGRNGNVLTVAARRL